MNRNTILACIAIIAIIIVGGLIYVKSNPGFSFPTIFGMSDQQIGKATVDYINNNQLSQTPATLVSVSEVSGLVKVKIKIGTSDFDSYATKDGKLLFPQAFEMAPKKVTTPDGKDTKDTGTPTSLQKKDSPMLEAFVV
ncbi:MAG: hypothetical protein NT094_05695, partial [Candidatus Staskawiczbacteria bacterium]|nr:hypothetical protein [Candidatus Staskawiczbacteria bacterium]